MSNNERTVYVTAIIAAALFASVFVWRMAAPDLASEQRRAMQSCVSNCTPPWPPEVKPDPACVEACGRVVERIGDAAKETQP